MLCILLHAVLLRDCKLRAELSIFWLPEPCFAITPVIYSPPWSQQSHVDCLLHSGLLECDTGMDGAWVLQQPDDVCLL